MAALAPTVAVKCGAEGAMGAQGDARERVAAYPVVVRSTTGAGDTFDGAFLAGWLRGEPLRRCLELGNAAGALTTTEVGGFNGQPTWEEALRFIAAHDRASPSRRSQRGVLALRRTLQGPSGGA
jgi:ribokinase